MRLVLVDAVTFNALRGGQIKLRSDCHAAFTATPAGEIWPFAQWGNTFPQNRTDVRGCSQVLDEIADELLCWRPEGGRFFIDIRGAFFRETERGQNDQFVRFPAFDKRLPLGAEKY